MKGLEKPQSTIGVGLSSEDQISLPALVMFLERSIVLDLQSITGNKSGRPAVANWGEYPQFARPDCSSPVTEEILWTVVRITAYSLQPTGTESHRPPDYFKV